MSIEVALATLTEAVKANTAALGGAAAKPGKTANKDASPTGQIQTAASIPVKTVADAFVKLAEKNRDSAVALLGKYGAKKVSELKAEVYGTFIAEIGNVMASLDAPAGGSDLV